jgi:hypothetical protein
MIVATRVQRWPRRHRASVSADRLSALCPDLWHSWAPVSVPADDVRVRREPARGDRRVATARRASCDRLLSGRRGRRSSAGRRWVSRISPALAPRSRRSSSRPGRSDDPAGAQAVGRPTSSTSPAASLRTFSAPWSGRPSAGHWSTRTSAGPPSSAAPPGRWPRGPRLRLPGQGSCRCRCAGAMARLRRRFGRAALRRVARAVLGLIAFQAPREVGRPGDRRGDAVVGRDGRGRSTARRGTVWRGRRSRTVRAGSVPGLGTGTRGRAGSRRVRARSVRADRPEAVEQ